MNEWNDYPTESKSIPWKLIAIIAGGVIVAILILWAVVFWLRKDENQPLVLLDERTGSIEENCDQTADPETCKKVKLEENAVVQANVQLCDMLEGDDRDGCVWEVAVELGDQTLCQAISNSASQVLCADEIVYDAAVASGSIAACDKIQDEIKRAGCKEGIEPVTVENCAQIQQDPAYCHLLSVTEDAKKKQDRRLCSEFAGEDFIACVEQVLVDDPDFDGLSTSEELDLYQSDPDHADTDGDGYQDGAEVEAGYDPAGSGKL